MTTDPETTWALGECAGSPVCETDERPRLVVSGPDVGTFVPAGAHLCAATVLTNVVQPISVTWASGATTLTDDELLTTEPPKPLGYLLAPENVTVPWLFEAQCTSGFGGGLATRFEMLRTFAGGGTCPVAASGWSITSIAGSALEATARSDGSAVVAITGPAGPAATPRVHMLTARVGAMDVSTTSITLQPVVDPEIHLLPVTVGATGAGDSTPTAQALLVIPAAMGFAFDLTTIGDPANIAAGATFRSPYHWSCAGAIDATRASPLYPWTEAECPNTLGAASAGPLRCAGTAAPGTALLDLVAPGVFRQAASTGGPGVRTLTMSFPYAGAPSAITTTMSVDIR